LAPRRWPLPSVPRGMRSWWWLLCAMRLALLLCVLGITLLVTACVTEPLEEHDAYLTLYALVAVVLELNRMVLIWACIGLLRGLASRGQGTGSSTQGGASFTGRPPTTSALAVVMISALLALVYGTLIAYCHLQQSDATIRNMSLPMPILNLLLMCGVQGSMQSVREECEANRAELKTFQLTDTEYALAKQSEPVCPICLADLESGETLGKLYCGHCFHQACIRRWLAKKVASEAPCPMRCRGLPLAGDASCAASGQSTGSSSSPGIETTGAAPLPDARQGAEGGGASEYGGRLPLPGLVCDVEDGRATLTTSAVLSRVLKGDQATDLPA